MVLCLVMGAIAGCELVAGIDDKRIATEATGGGRGGGGAGGAGGGGQGGAPLDSGEVAWARRFGDASNQGARQALASGGRVLVHGVFKGAIDFGTGPHVSAGASDLFLAGFDGADGSTLWSRAWGNADDQNGGFNGWGRGALDPDGDLLVAGDFTGMLTLAEKGTVSSLGGADWLIAELDGGTGAIDWVRRVGNAHPQYGRNVAADASGNVYFCGHSKDGTVDFGDGSHDNTDGLEDFVVAKLAPDGQTLWSRWFAPTVARPAFCSAVAVGAEGSVIATGTTHGAIDFGGGVRDHAGEGDVFLLQLDAQGNHLHSATFGDEHVQFGQRLAFEPGSETVFVGGVSRTTTGTPATVDFGGGALVAHRGGWLARFDSGWSHGESRIYEGLNKISSLDVGPDGSLVLSGVSRASIDFGGGPLVHAGGKDGVVVEWTSSMTHVYSRRFAGDGEDDSTDLVRAAAVDGDGAVFVVGSFHGTMTLDDVVLESAGNLDLFVAKLAP